MRERVCVLSLFNFFTHENCSLLCFNCITSNADANRRSGTLGSAISAGVGTMICGSQIRGFALKNEMTQTRKLLLQSTFSFAAMLTNPLIRQKVFATARRPSLLKLDPPQSSSSLESSCFCFQEVVTRLKHLAFPLSDFNSPAPEKTQSVRLLCSD